MAEFDNTNRGVLFKNDNKKEDKHPDYQGKINVDGVDKQISLWIKTSNKDGKKFFSASISEPYVKKEEQVKQVVNSVIEEDDLPF